MDLFPNDKEVLVVDYVTSPEKQMELHALAQKYGFVPYATVRDLDKLTIPIWLQSTTHSTDIQILVIVASIGFATYKKHYR